MLSMIRLSGLVGATLVVASLWGLGCSGGQKKKDLPPVDEGYTFARKMPLDLEVNDRVDASQRGRIRWRYIEPDDTGTFTLTFKLQNANVAGDLRLVNSSLQTLQQIAIIKGKAIYRFQVRLNKGERYYVKILATEGNTRYQLAPQFVPEKTVVTVPKNQCQGCTANQACVGGQCVYPVPGMATRDCVSKCGRGQFCVSGKCFQYCLGPCGGREWCNRSSNKCETDPCHRKRKQCNSSKWHCSRSGTRCYVKRAKGPKNMHNCNPPCGPGRKCWINTCYRKPVWTEKYEAWVAKRKCKRRCKKGFVCMAGTCQKKGSTPVVFTGGSIAARIVSPIPTSKGTLLNLSRGSEHGVKVGAWGKIKGVSNGSFRIRQVFPYRSIAFTKATLSDIGSARSVVIKK